jgi:hypothetical protein
MVIGNTALTRSVVLLLACLGASSAYEPDLVKLCDASRQMKHEAGANH